MDNFPPLNTFSIPFSVADPGFLVGGHQSHGGAPTPDVHKIYMSKRKNWDP